MTIFVRSALTGFALSNFALAVRAEDYPEASPEQGTEAAKSELRIERYRGMDEAALQAESPHVVRELAGFQ